MVELVTLGDVGIDSPEIMACQKAAESGYRRGVSQALSIAADMIKGKGSRAYDALCKLCDESMTMRYDRKPHPTYLDELKRRIQ